MAGSNPFVIVATLRCGSRRMFNRKTQDFPKHEGGRYSAAVKCGFASGRSAFNRMWQMIRDPSFTGVTWTTAPLDQALGMLKEA